jgi:hypothetical protein
VMSTPAVCVAAASTGDRHCSPVPVLIKVAAYECHHEDARSIAVSGVLQGFPRDDTLAVTAGYR